MNIEIMNESHFDKVLEMSRIFYASDALDHEVPIDIISDNIKTAISDNDSLDGYVLVENGEIAGLRM